MELGTLEKRLESLERSGLGLKICIISFFESVPDLFTGIAYDPERDDKSLLINLAPWIAYRTSVNRTVGYPSHHDPKANKYCGLRLYDDNHLTVSFDAHKREIYKLLRKLSLEETRDLKRYLKIAKRL